TIDSASSAYTNIGGIRDRHDWLVSKHSEHKARIDTVTNVVTGDWYVEWPDLSQTPEAPAVANLVELGVNHWTAVGGAILPSVRVPMNKTADRRKEKPAARKRERRIKEIWDASNASELAALLWGDYAGTGSAVGAAWVNFEEKDPAKRNPYLLRFDPRHCYVMKDNLGAITELHVARKISSMELKAMYPDWAEMFSRSDDEAVEEWFWYTADRVQYMLVDVSKDGRKGMRNVTLVDEEWDLGFVPAWEAVRPSFDGQRRGVFDQSIHILRTMQRLMLMTIMSTEEHAFPAIATYDAVNPEDFGPGGIVQLRSSEGRIDRLGPTAHFDVKDLIARLGEEAGKASVYPQQLSGDPGASIVSARGINASMGALDARLALAHKQFEVLFSKVSGFLLALDETFCDADKTIVGDSRDKNKAEKYRPSEDVAGMWAAIATYGIGAGSDPANVEVRLSMHLANGLLSRETARQQLPFLEDPDSESVYILREQMQDSLVQGILAMAQGGDPTMAAVALKLLRSDDVSLDDVVDQLVTALTAPPEPQPGAGGGGGALEAMQGAESLARGGIPGQASQAPPGMGMPPLGQMMGQDARLVS
ncbi:MAG TPA: hypothetical protein VM537_12985, partial [Anaerolineae bacterium]|nr:hypothetical protein [Anaerolineae bacterium]